MVAEAWWVDGCSNLLRDGLLLLVGFHFLVGLGLLDDDFLLPLLASAHTLDEAEVSFHLLEVTLLLEFTTLLEPEKDNKRNLMRTDFDAYPFNLVKDFCGFGDIGAAASAAEESRTARRSNGIHYTKKSQDFHCAAKPFRKPTEARTRLHRESDIA